MKKINIHKWTVEVPEGIDAEILGVTDSRISVRLASPNLSVTLRIHKDCAQDEVQRGVSMVSADLRAAENML